MFSCIICKIFKNTYFEERQLLELVSSKSRNSFPNESKRFTAFTAFKTEFKAFLSSCDNIAFLHGLPRCLLQQIKRVWLYLYHDHRNT